MATRSQIDRAANPHTGKGPDGAFFDPTGATLNLADSGAPFPAATWTIWRYARGEADFERLASMIGATS